jgi:uncharacterized protein YbjT (DUF2867 family)
MILVTGATGLVGRLLVAELLSSGAKVQAASRDPSAALPAGVDVVAADLHEPENLRPHLAGVEAVFLNPRAVGEHAAEIAALAAESGVRRLVALSAMNIDEPLDHQPSRLAGDRNKEVEDAVVGSGVSWTSLRPSSFASNTARAFGPQMFAGDVIRYVYAGFEESLIDERDIAAIAARALTSDDLAGRRLELTGPQSLSHAAQVQTIGTVLGRALRFEEVPPEVMAGQLAQRGMPRPFVDALFARYARHLDKPQHPPTGVVEQVLGRPARRYAEWVADNAVAFGG